jgi:hypothetical protein
MAIGGHAGLGGQQLGVAHGPCNKQPTILKGSATAPATNLNVPLTIMARGLSSHTGGGHGLGPHMRGAQAAGAHIGGAHMGAGPHTGGGQHGCGPHIGGRHGGGPQIGPPAEAWHTSDMASSAVNTAARQKALFLLAFM